MTIKRNKVIFFASLRPSRRNVSRNRARMRDYVISLQLLQLMLAARDAWEIVVCENTVGSMDEFLSTPLGALLHPDQVFLTSENRGKRNKGLGELDMLAQVMESPNFVHDARQIAYFTGRKWLCSPYPFEAAERCTSDILVSNPAFLWLDGRWDEPSPGVLNDMFFAMQVDAMREYSSFAKQYRVDMESGHLGSEQVLFRFVEQTARSVTYLERLGILRRNTPPLAVGLRHRKWGARRWELI